MGGRVVLVVFGVGDEVVVDDFDFAWPAPLPFGAGHIFLLGLLLHVFLAG